MSRAAALERLRALTAALPDDDLAVAQYVLERLVDGTTPRSRELRDAKGLVENTVGLAITRVRQFLAAGPDPIASPSKIGPRGGTRAP